MNRIWQDLRYAFRMMRKKPGFAFFAILTLSLGIGINTVVFTIVNTILLRPIPAKNPDELIRIYQKTADGAVQLRFSYPDYVDYRDRSSLLSGLAASTLTPFRLDAGSQSEQILAEAVSGNYFAVLGVAMSSGRLLTPGDEKRSVVVISQRLWRTRFAQEPNLAGKTLRLNGKPYDIIGVMNPKFGGTFAAARIDAWVPLLISESMMGSEWQKDRNKITVHMLGRLKEGVTLEQADAELATVAAQLEKTYPETNRGKKILTATATLLHGNLRKGATIFFAVVMVLMGIVLFIACSNLASLLVTRAIERRREMAIRISLGADRKQLMIQLFTESLLLAFLGGAAGLLAAYWSSNLLVSLWPVPTVPIHFDFSPDAKVLGFCFAVTVFTGIFLGLTPILQSNRQDVVTDLKEQTGMSLLGRMRIKNGLVIAQIGFSLLLLVCAGLFVRSWQNTQRLDPGFNPENMLAMDIDLSERGFTESQGLLYYEQLKERVQRLPGVTALAFADLAPMDLATPKTPAQIPGHNPPADQTGFLISSNIISPGYFQSLQVPLLNGREFTEKDTANTPAVVIINETMAKKYWPNQDPLGRQFQIGKDFKPVTIVGIAKDVKYRTPGEEPTPHMYRSFKQFYQPGLSLLVRTQANPETLQLEIEKEMSTIHKDVQAFFARTLEEHLAFSFLPAKLGGSLLGMFGLLGLILACAGIYAAMSFQVAQRTREIGIRMAIGAKPRAILRLFIQRGLKLSLIGSFLGIAGAFAVTRFLSSLLVGVGTHDVFTYVAVPALLIFVSFLACAVPAYRASKLDPLKALRYE
jgi:macrolide transport system ATP-binding/permease protein